MNTRGIFFPLSVVRTIIAKYFCSTLRLSVQQRDVKYFSRSVALHNSVVRNVIPLIRKFHVELEEFLIPGFITTSFEMRFHAERGVPGIGKFSSSLLCRIIPIVLPCRTVRLVSPFSCNFFALIVNRFKHCDTFVVYIYCFPSTS
jgi:hypothetical protein